MRPTRTGDSDPVGPPSGQHRISGTLRISDAEEDSGPRRTGRTPRPAARRRPTRAGTFVRGLTGCLSAGFAVLALGLIGVQFWAIGNGQQGPGPGRLITHVAVAALVLVLQRVADRRRDRAGGLAAFGVLGCVLGSIWFWWWL